MKYNEEKNLLVRLWRYMRGCRFEVWCISWATGGGVGVLISDLRVRNVPSVVGREMEIYTQTRSRFMCRSEWWLFLDLFITNTMSDQKVVHKWTWYQNTI